MGRQAARGAGDQDLAAGPRQAWLGEELPAEGQDARTPFAPRCVKDLVEEALFARRRDLFSELGVPTYILYTREDHIAPVTPLPATSESKIRDARHPISVTCTPHIRDVSIVTCTKKSVPYHRACLRRPR